MKTEQALLPRALLFLNLDKVGVNDDEVSTTGEDGRISFILPDGDELEIKAVKGKLKGKLEIDLERD